MRMAYTGGCLCGACRYEFDAFTGHVDHCHCRFCQKSHGAAFGTYAEVVASGFRWVGDTAQLGRYQSSTHSARVFCRNCGSSLQAEIDGGKILAVTAATLDEGTALPAPGEHMFVRSRAPWYRGRDELPEYEEYPPYLSGFSPE